MVNRASDLRCANILARVVSERSGTDMRDREVILFVLLGEGYAESPAAVIPGRFSSRRILREGKESNVESLNEVAGKDET